MTSFAEPDNNQGPRSIWAWFARDETRPLMFFAGIWREWEGDRGTKTNPLPGKHLVFSFLTTDASPDVAPNGICVYGPKCHCSLRREWSFPMAPNDKPKPPPLAEGTEIKLKLPDLSPNLWTTSSAYVII